MTASTSQPVTHLSRLTDPMNLAGSSTLHQDLLRTLNDYGRERQDGVRAAYKGTFEWIWTYTEVNFPAWVSSNQPLFWIRGKPRSGKSTIMQYIWNYSMMSELVDKRKESRPAVKAAFFFHYRGNHSQKSFEGMLHTILHRLLACEPRLASPLLAQFETLDQQQRETYVWTLPKLMKAYEDVLEHNTFPVGILLFIDALDVYDGPPEAIVDFILTSVQKSSRGATQLKICFSSREWDAFEQGFPHGPGFRIHEYTKTDIARYISLRLSDDPNISGRLNSANEQELSGVRVLQTALSDRTNGVFIWVRAVMDEIQRLSSRNAPISQLLGFLRNVPDDLDQLYTDSIKRLPHEYRREAYYMFEIMLRCNGLLNVSVLREVVSCAGIHRLGDCVHIIEKDVNHITALRSWAKGRGAGLVEVTDEDEVQLIHQTVFDFISRPGLRSIFGHAYELSDENGYTFLSKWRLANKMALNRRVRAGRELPPPLRYPDYGCFIESGEVRLVQSRDPVLEIPNILALAEQTTGRSMRTYLDDVDVDVILEQLGRLRDPVAASAKDPRPFFAVAQGLTILDEMSRDHDGKVPDEGDFSLLHCLCDLASGAPRELELRGMLRGQVFDSGYDHIANTAQFLLQRGARPDAKHRGNTPWATLFKGYPYYKYTDDRSFFQECHPVNNLARVMLHAGQDPNHDIIFPKLMSWDRQKREYLTGKAYISPHRAWPSFSFDTTRTSTPWMRTAEPHWILSVELGAFPYHPASSTL